MFDILVYLFETYPQPDSFPESAALARKLSAVGFEREDISDALEWLSALEPPGHDEFPPRNATKPDALRVYCARELARLPVECRGYLSFLEGTGAIDGVLREMIVERAMALRDACVPLDKLKIIALMVLWRRHPAIESLDGLLLEELLSVEDGDSPAPVH